ncbi:C-type lectin domain family 2 member B-like [Anableps anableps]
MSCNIYEDPDETMKLSYSKEVRGKGQERVENVVDIYESIETLTCHRVNPTRRAREWQEFLRLSHFYYASTEKKNWTESREDCKRRGGDLVILNERKKQEMITRMKIHGDSWIGLQTTDMWEMKWQWVDRSELQYSSWKQQTNTIPDAGSKAYTDQQGLWMYDKTGIKHWICEKRTVQYLGDRLA